MAVRRWFLAWVLIALLGTQALGQMHRVVHAQGGLPAHSHGQDWPTADAAFDEVAGEGWIAALFGAHQGYSGCLSFDAVGHGGLAPPAAIATPALPPVHELVPRVRAALADFRCTPFQARAPPVSR